MVQLLTLISILTAIAVGVWLVARTRGQNDHLVYTPSASDWLYGATNLAFGMVTGAGILYADVGDRHWMKPKRGQP